MRGGRLDRRITLRTSTEVLNDLGEKRPTWSTLAKVWANIDHRPGKDTEKSDSRFFSRAVSFVIRHRSDLGPDDQVVWDGKTYRIESVNEIHYSRKRWLKISCVLLGLQDG